MRSLALVKGGWLGKVCASGCVVEMGFLLRRGGSGRIQHGWGSRVLMDAVGGVMGFVRDCGGDDCTV